VKLREAIAIEDRHGNPSGGHYLYHGSAIAAAVLIEMQWRPVQGVVRWAVVTIDPPKWSAFFVFLLFMALGAVCTYHLHTPLFRFRWYRRIFRRGAVPYAISGWLLHIIMYLWAWSLLVVMMEIAIGKR